MDKNIESEMGLRKINIGEWDKGIVDEKERRKKGLEKIL